MGIVILMLSTKQIKEKQTTMAILNFGGVTTNDFEVLPIGTYNAFIFDIKLKTSQAGDGYYNWEFTVSDDDYKGRKIFMVTSLKPEALWKLKKTLQDLTGETLDGEFEFEAAEFIGCEVAITIKHRTWEGKTQMDVVRSEEHTSELQSRQYLVCR